MNHALKGHTRVKQKKKNSHSNTNCNYIEKDHKYKRCDVDLRFEEQIIQPEKFLFNKFLSLTKKIEKSYILFNFLIDTNVLQIEQQSLRFISSL